VLLGFLDTNPTRQRGSKLNPRWRVGLVKHANSTHSVKPETVLMTDVMTSAQK
jgi:hypothetical protein